MQGRRSFKEFSVHISLSNPLGNISRLKKMNFTLVFPPLAFCYTIDMHFYFTTVIKSQTILINALDVLYRADELCAFKTIKIQSLLIYFDKFHMCKGTFCISLNFVYFIIILLHCNS